MKHLVLHSLIWILWLYTPKGGEALGTYNTLEECRNAKAYDPSGLIHWKTVCRENK